MKYLIERWRGEFSNNTARECADELQAWLDGLWTEITDDPVPCARFSMRYALIV